MPLATKYDVTIDAGTTAISGRTLAAPYTFSFMTPPAYLVQTQWYRPGGRSDAAPVIALRFNQPVKPDDVVAHTRAAFQRHDFTPPVIPQGVQARLRALDPSALQAFTAKVQRARDAAAATSPVALVLAKDWDKKRLKPSPDLVVLQATTPVPPESWVRIAVDGRLPSLAGLAVSNRVQDYTGKAQTKDWTPGLLVTQYGKIVPGKWLHSQAAASSGRLAEARKTLSLNPTAGARRVARRPR